MSKDKKTILFLKKKCEKLVKELESLGFKKAKPSEVFSRIFAHLKKSFLTLEEVDNFYFTEMQALGVRKDKGLLKDETLADNEAQCLALINITHRENIKLKLKIKSLEGNVTKGEVIKEVSKPAESKKETIEDIAKSEVKKAMKNGMGRGLHIV